MANFEGRSKIFWEENTYRADAGDRFKFKKKLIRDNAFHDQNKYSENSIVELVDVKRIFSGKLYNTVGYVYDSFFLFFWIFNVFDLKLYVYCFSYKIWY